MSCNVDYSRKLWFAPLVLAVGTLIPAPIQRTPRRRRRRGARAHGAGCRRDDHARRSGRLAVTVYNSDIALVRDVRNLQLARGTSDLHFMDIAATVNPATVHFRSLTEPSRVSVLEQNYEYDLLEPDKLLRKYVGRDVTLVRTRQDGSTTREEEVKARLLSYNNAPVWQIGSEIVTGMQRRSHPVSRAARQPLLAADAHLDARQHRRHAAPRRGVVPGRQAVVERRLRADRRARRQGRRPRRLGDASSTAAARRSGTRRCSSSPAI